MRRRVGAEDAKPLRGGSIPPGRTTGPGNAFPEAEETRAVQRRTHAPAHIIEERRESECRR